MEAVQSKPIFKEGGALGAILDANEVAENNPAPQPPASTEPNPAATPAPDKVIEPTNGTATAPQGEPAAPTPPSENNSSDFAIPDFEQQPQAQADTQVQPSASAATSSWKDIIKSVDRKELFKEVGLSDFAMELDDYMRTGGQPADYLNAKAIDWNQVSDEDVVKGNLRAKYPTFTPEQINRFYNKQYGVSEDATDDEREDASLMLKAEAHGLRQQKITEQSKFTIPSVSNAQAEFDKQLQAQQAAQAQAANQAIQWYNEHEATKSLMTSKRVALDLGDGVAFNYKIDKPESLMRIITDSDLFAKVTSTPQGEPNVSLLQKLALYATNPVKFERDLFNFGKSFALPAIVTEGQNLSKQSDGIPNTVDNKTEKDVWKAPKQSTIGGR